MDELEYEVADYLIHNVEVLRQDFSTDQQCFLDTQSIFYPEFLYLFQKAYKQFILSLLIYHLINVFNSNYERISLILENEHIKMFIEENFYNHAKL